MVIIYKNDGFEGQWMHPSRSFARVKGSSSQLIVWLRMVGGSILLIVIADSNLEWMEMMYVWNNQLVFASTRLKTKCNHQYFMVWWCMMIRLAKAILEFCLPSLDAGKTGNHDDQPVCWCTWPLIGQQCLTMSTGTQSCKWPVRETHAVSKNRSYT